MPQASPLSWAPGKRPGEGLAAYIAERRLIGPDLKAIGPSYGGWPFQDSPAVESLEGRIPPRHPSERLSACRSTSARCCCWMRVEGATRCAPSSPLLASTLSSKVLLIKRL